MLLISMLGPCQNKRLYFVMARILKHVYLLIFSLPTLFVLDT